jgi:tetratricopeptide (TPR) repeat protein
VSLNWSNLRATEQLAAELAAGRFDSPLTRHLVAGANPYPRLLRACFLAERRELGRARADIAAALAGAQPNPVIEMVAGLLLFVTHDYQRALDQFERAATRSPAAARRARQMAVSAAVALGWEHDVRALLERAIAEDPSHASWHAQAVRFYSRGHWWAQALVHAEPALELEPNNPTLWMEVAGLHARLDERERARAALERALELAPAEQRSTYLREAGRVAIDAGEFGRAQACLHEALQLDPDQVELHVWLAELASWRDDDEAAREQAERALSRRPDYPPALRMLGALELRAGRHAQALELLERAIAGDPKDYQAHVWLTELYLRTARYEQAHAQLHHGTMNSGGYLFVAWLLRFLIVAYDEGEVAAVVPARIEEFEDVLRELVPELAERALHTRSHADTVAAVEAALAALRGNRSIYATQLVDAAGDGGRSRPELASDDQSRPQLVRLHTRTGCRHRSRAALQRLRVAEPERCLAEFDEIIARYPRSSLPICHRGELHLWLGNWPQARADLERAIELVTGTRWAYMGLSTLDLIAGDPEAALATNARGVAVMNNSEGPAIHVFRGEALRKLGRLDEAIAELEQAVAWHPARASATINLALAHAAKGTHAELWPLWERLAVEQAAGLISDAAHELGLAIFGDGDWRPPITTIVAVLERALTMMGGNRSSGLLTYWTAAGTLRFVQQWPHGNRSPNSRDHLRIARAKQMLLKALAGR